MGARPGVIVCSVSKLWFLAAAIPSFVVLELVVPRVRMPVRWRAIAAAAAVMAFNTIVVRLLAVAPPSTSTLRIALAWLLAEVEAGRDQAVAAFEGDLSMRDLCALFGASAASEAG
jgi:hypothetical protein